LDTLIQHLPTLLPLAIGIVLGWFAHVLTCRRDSKTRLTKAKDEFMAIMADQRAKLSVENQD
jgi:hypothetical protein